MLFGYIELGGMTECARTKKESKKNKCLYQLQASSH